MSTSAVPGWRAARFEPARPFPRRAGRADPEAGPPVHGTLERALAPEIPYRLRRRLVRRHACASVRKLQEVDDALLFWHEKWNPSLPAANKLVRIWE